MNALIYKFFNSQGLNHFKREASSSKASMILLCATRSLEFQHGTSILSMNVNNKYGAIEFYKKSRPIRATF